MTVQNFRFVKHVVLFQKSMRTLGKKLKVSDPSQLGVPFLKGLSEFFFLSDYDDDDDDDG